MLIALEETYDHFRHFLFHLNLSVASHNVFSHKTLQSPNSAKIVMPATEKTRERNSLISFNFLCMVRTVCVSLWNYQQTTVSYPVKKLEHF